MHSGKKTASAQARNAFPEKREHNSASRWFMSYLWDRRRRAPLRKCGMLKLDSAVHRLDSDIVSESCQRGRCKGGFWRASEGRRRLSGFRRRRPTKQSWQVLLQQLSWGPNFFCTGTSAASCGINTSAERTRCPPLSSNFFEKKKKSNPGRILKGTQGARVCVCVCEIQVRCWQTLLLLQG